MENDGTEPDYFKLSAKGKPGQHEVTWMDGEEEVTDDVVSGDWVSDLLLPGESQELVVMVTLAEGTKSGKGVSRKVRVRSVSLPASRDTVKFRVEVE